MPSSYNGWPASRSASAIGVVHFEPFRGYDFPGGVKKGDVQTIFTYLVRQLDKRVEPIEHYPPGDEWGWYYKMSANSPNLLSCHASGTAIDYNATKHPNGVRGTWSAAQVREVRKILAECSGVVRWLYDARRRPDEMHFEISASAYAVMLAARKIRGMAPPPIVTDPEFKMDTEARQAFSRVETAITHLTAKVVEMDNDVPENLAEIQRELRINLRNVFDELNRVRKNEGQPPIKVVVGFDPNGNPIYET